MSDSITKRFIRAAAKQPDKTAVSDKKGEEWLDISYGDMARMTRSLGAFLAEKGADKGSKIAIISENRHEWPLVFLSALSVGAVAVPLSAESPKEEIANILRDSGCAFMFADGDSLSLAKDAARESPSVREIISIDSDTFRNAVNGSVEGLPETETEPDGLACILYTSGTTDAPKGVMLSHGNLLSNCDSIDKLGTVTPDDSVFSVLPLHHTYPLTGTLIFPLIKGGRIVYPRTMHGEAMLEAMRQTAPTVFFAVPQIYTAFHERIGQALRKIPFPFNMLFNFAINSLYKLRKATGLNLSRLMLRGIHSKFGRGLRLFVSGGAKLDPGVQEGLCRLGFTLIEGYGLTETSPVLTLNPPGAAKPGSAGKAIPDVEIRITDINEAGTGEVVARGPNIMEGYYNRPDLTKEVMESGWFHTGDLGYLDEEGYLYLTGRKKELLVLSSGLNVYPEELEKAYSEHAPVREMCVFEAPSKEGGTTSALWAIVTPDLEFFKKYAEVNLHDVIKERFDNVSRQLPPYKRLMGFSITLDDLPRTVLGKIKRYAVEKKYGHLALKEARAVSGEKALSSEDRALMDDEISALIIAYLEERFCPAKKIVPDDLLELDLGIDSLGRIELASGLEGLLGLTIKDEIIGGAFTVRDLLSGIKSFLRESGESVTTGEGREAAPVPWKKLLDIPPRKENLDKIDLAPGFWDWLGCFLFIGVFWLIFRIFFGLRTEGWKNYPKNGSYILYSNHTSYLDGLLLASALPRFPRLELFFVGFRPYFNVPVIRNLIKTGRIIPLDFSTHLLEALRSSYYVLKNGKALCLFPEGLRTLDGSIKKFKKGFGILVKETGAPVIPVILEGAFEAWPRTRKFPRRHPLKVRFGKALDPVKLMKRGREMGAGDDYDAICLAAREELVKLKA